MEVFITQLYLSLCDHMDNSPPGSFVHGILQGKILEWVAVPFSRDFNLRYADDTTLMTEYEDKLKNLFMRVKKKSEKAILKLVFKELR